MAHEGEGYVVPYEVRESMQDIAEFLKEIAPKLDLVDRSRAFFMAGQLDSFARGPAGTFEINPLDLQFNVWRSGIDTPTKVAVIHTPSGLSAEATDKSQLRAKDQAVEDLRKQLQARNEQEQVEKRDREYPS